MNGATNPAEPENTAMSTAPKSQRAGKLQMTKLDRAYDANRAAFCAIRGEMEVGGCTSEMFERQAKLDAERLVIIEQMDALKATCAGLGWYVSGKWLGYWGSATTALVHANMD